MTKSVICEYIAKHPQTWLQDISAMDIKVKFDNELDPIFAIFNYDICADFFNPIVKEARGIVIDIRRLIPVCWGFNKFGNYHEAYVDTIDWTTARVQDKIDGSIMKLWYNPYARKWQWSTNGVIFAENAEVSSLACSNFMQLISMADNYSSIDYDSLNKAYTYIFELVSPENQIVIKYDKTHLYHLGTRNNVTGEELITDIDIEHPHEYAVHSFEDCLKAAEALNVDDVVKYEGFVVVDADWHRIKVKNSTYLFFHHFTNNRILNKSILIEFLRSDDCDVETLVENFKSNEAIIRYYDDQIRQLEINVQTYMNYVRALYKQLNYDRKALALQIKSHRWAGFGFNAITNEHVTAKELLARCSKNSYEAMIPDYKET